MELLKPKDNLSCTIGDVTFNIRPQMTVRDKFELDIIGEYKDGAMKITRGDLIHKLVELFVVNWSGVTQDGKPVPYSYDTLMNQLPADQTEDYIIKLGTFIVDAIGLLPKEAEKNA